MNPQTREFIQRLKDDPSSCPQCDLTPFFKDRSLPVIDVRDLRFAYHDAAPVIRGVTFQVAHQERVAVAGPNGSGKTTLLKLVSGLLRPTGGSAALSGMTLDKKSADQAFRYAGIVFQDPNDQLFCSHVFDDVAFGLQNLGLGQDEMTARVAEALRLTEGLHLIERPIHHLSVGEMKRVALAGVIAMRPPVILLDEPTAGLDPAATDHFIELMAHLNREHGYAFVTVTHEMDHLPKLSDRVIVLSQGQIVADRGVRSVMTDVALLERVRLHPPEITKYFYEVNKSSGRADQLPLTVEEAIKIHRG